MWRRRALSFVGLLIAAVLAVGSSESGEGTPSIEIPSTAVACDRSRGQTVRDAMIESAGVTVREADGWVIVRVGSSYAEWTSARAETWVTMYANADACVTGRARRLEFQTPSGRVFARADEVRGIRMH